MIAKLKFEVNRKCSRARELSPDSVVNDYMVIPETHEIRRGNKICQHIGYFPYLLRE